MGGRYNVLSLNSELASKRLYSTNSRYGGPRDVTQALTLPGCHLR